MEKTLVYGNKRTATNFTLSVDARLRDFAGFRYRSPWWQGSAVRPSAAVQPIMIKKLLSRQWITIVVEGKVRQTRKYLVKTIGRLKPNKPTESILSAISQTSSFIVIVFSYMEMVPYQSRSGTKKLEFPFSRQPHFSNISCYHLIK